MPGVTAGRAARTEASTSSSIARKASAAWTLNRESGSWPPRPTRWIPSRSSATKER